MYRAQDTRLERTVAIKVLPSHVASNPDARARFEREARTISKLNHPHICTLHDVGRENGVDFLVMEHIEGETLAERLQKGPLPVEEALQQAIEIADARTDIFAFGAVLYEMATGDKAFHGKSQASLIGAILKDQPPPISSSRAAGDIAPLALDRMVRKCLSKDPR